MSKPNTDNKTPSRPAKDDAQDGAQAARERELRQLIEGAEQDKSGAPPAHESAHDFVERRMRETFKRK